MEANNAAAMREALECALAVLDGFGYARPDCVRAAYDCKAALAAPPRNCDVGTAEEQAKRLSEWCSGRHCANCQFKGGWPDECKLRWAQMPYEEGGEK